MTNEIPKDVREALACGDWFGASSRLERHRLNEEEDALCEHNKRWHQIQTAFQSECEKDGGHDFRDLPNNGINRPHFFTGEWPRACRKCGMRETPNTTLSHDRRRVAP